MDAEVRNVHKIGNVDSADAASPVRIVHISDTHMRHEDYKHSLPAGDILIHSGDFSQWGLRKQFGRKRNLRRDQLQEINRFFGNLPSFKHKIFVPGNHESGFTPEDKEYLECNLVGVTYLQDKMVTVEGINIYGSPWTANRWYSYASAFTGTSGKLDKYWDLIPEHVDILVTHMPPLGVLDQATKKFSGLVNLFQASEGECNICGDTHPKFQHWGCKHLKSVVLKKIRPAAHLFGHVHECNGITTVDGITFSNAAMKLQPKINVLDFYK